jgi:hypothetical protein
MSPYGSLAREKLNHDTIMGWEKLTRSPGISRRVFSIRTGTNQEKLAVVKQCLLAKETYTCYQFKGLFGTEAFWA